MGDPQSPYGPTLYRMQVTILTSKDDVKRTRGLDCLTGGRPGAERHSGMVLLEGHGELCAEIFERIEDEGESLPSPS